jgi:hypothetical protein
MKAQGCERNLLEIIAALNGSRGRPGILHGWQKQCEQQPDNCNHDQQFNHGKCATIWRHADHAGPR